MLTGGSACCTVAAWGELGWCRVGTSEESIGKRGSGLGGSGTKCSRCDVCEEIGITGTDSAANVLVVFLRCPHNCGRLGVSLRRLCLASIDNRKESEDINDINDINDMGEHEASEPYFAQSGIGAAIFCCSGSLGNNYQSVSTVSNLFTLITEWR
jgi:hypothetical protein